MNDYQWLLDLMVVWVAFSPLALWLAWRVGKNRSTEPETFEEMIELQTLRDIRHQEEMEDGELDV